MDNLWKIPPPRNWLSIFFWMSAIAQDDVLDVLELLVKDLLAKSQRDGKQARLRTLKDLDTAALRLSQACRLLLESEVAPDKVREAVFEQIDAETLSAALKQVETLARLPEDQYYPEVLARSLISLVMRSRQRRKMGLHSNHR